MIGRSIAEKTGSSKEDEAWGQQMMRFVNAGIAMQM
jgi:hypothetical protein